MNEIPTPEGEHWYLIENGGFTYEVKAISREVAEEFFRLWVDNPVEVDWVNRVWP